MRDVPLKSATKKLYVPGMVLYFLRMISTTKYMIFAYMNI